MGILVVVAAFTVLFFIAEIARRQMRVCPDYSRPCIHLCAGVLALASPIVLTRDELVSLSVLFVIALYISKRMRLLTSIHSVQRATWGELFFPAGVGLAAILYLPRSPDVYRLAVLIMALSDPLAFFLGRQLASPKLIFGKSVLGSSVFFLSSVTISLFFVSPAHALVVAALATVVEALSPYGSDNLTIVAAVGVVSLLT